MASRSTRIPFTPNQLLLIVGIIMLVLFCFGYTSRLIASSELKAEVGYWEREVALSQQELEGNQEYLEYTKTDAFVEEAARRMLGWTYPGDTAVWVVGTDEPHAEATPVEQAMLPSWQAWWQRFFGP